MTSYRLTRHAAELVERMATGLGISRTALIELLVREAADRRGMTCPLTTIPPLDLERGESADEKSAAA